MFAAADFPEPTATIQTTCRTTQPPTPEELAVEAAMTAYNGMRQVTDAARRDPGVKDWRPKSVSSPETFRILGGPVDPGLRNHGD